MLSRRALIGKAAVGAATALALGAARTGAAFTRTTPGAVPGGPGGAPGGPHAWPGGLDAGPSGPAGDQDAQAVAPPSAESAPAEVASAPVASPPPWELVSPLAAGSVVAHGWRLSDLSPVRDGSCVVTLQNKRGRLQRIHLCRNDGHPQGLVYTRRVDLVVMNEGYGELPTDERLAQAVAELSHTVAANETTVPRRVFADLLPHAERVRRFAAAEGAAAEGKLR